MEDFIINYFNNINENLLNFRTELLEKYRNHVISLDDRYKKLSEDYKGLAKNLEQEREKNLSLDNEVKNYKRVSMIATLDKKIHEQEHEISVLNTRLESYKRQLEKKDSIQENLHMLSVENHEMAKNPSVETHEIQDIKTPEKYDKDDVDLIKVIKNPSVENHEMAKTISENLELARNLEIEFDKVDESSDENTEENIEEEIEEEIEYEERKINKKLYYVSNETPNGIYIKLEDDDVGEKVGEYINKKAKFFKH